MQITTTYRTLLQNNAVIHTFLKRHGVEQLRFTSINCMMGIRFFQNAAAVVFVQNGGAAATRCCRVPWCPCWLRTGPLQDL